MRRNTYIRGYTREIGQPENEEKSPSKKWLLISDFFWGSGNPGMADILKALAEDLAISGRNGLPIALWIPVECRLS